LKKEILLENKFSGKFIVLDGPDGCGMNIIKKYLIETTSHLKYFAGEK
jgi:hypothetical protein